MGIHQHAAFSRYVINRSVDVRSRHDKKKCDDPVVILSEAAANYQAIRGAKKCETFHRSVTRATEYLIATSGDKEIHTYSRNDANKFRATLVKKGLAGSSIARTIGTIRAVLNFAINEHAIKMENPFERVQFDKTQGTKVRETIPTNLFSSIQQKCFDHDDEARWLIALLSDTGLRLAEAAGLLKSDLNIAADHPHVTIRLHKWRPLKTRSSERSVPLVGASLWAANRIIQKNQKSKFAFPRYNKGKAATATNSASAALKKWIKSRSSEDYTLHGFRHAMRDRLRSVECPSEIIDQIGGWHTLGVGNKYGKGYGLNITTKWLSRIVIKQ